MPVDVESRSWESRNHCIAPSSQRGSEPSIIFDLRREPYESIIETKPLADSVVLQKLECVNLSYQYTIYSYGLSWNCILSRVVKKGCSVTLPIDFAYICRIQMSGETLNAANMAVGMLCYVSHQSWMITILIWRKKKHYISPCC